MEKTIGYILWTLTPTELFTSRTWRTSLHFWCKKIHEYLFGRLFTLVTDNLPLKSLFNENQGIPQHASSRIQRSVLKLAWYEYTISFRPTHKHGNADTLSRLLVKDLEGKDEDVPTELVRLMEAMDQMPIRAENISKWTQSDPLLTHVYRPLYPKWLAYGDTGNIKTV